MNIGRKYGVCDRERVYILSFDQYCTRSVHRRRFQTPVTFFLPILFAFTATHDYEEKQLCLTWRLFNQLFTLKQNTTWCKWSSENLEKGVLLSKESLIKQILVYALLLKLKWQNKILSCNSKALKQLLLGHINK